jgi:hypothetical protein
MNFRKERTRVHQRNTMRGYCVTALHRTHIHSMGIEIGRNGVGDDSDQNLKCGTGKSENQKSVTKFTKEKRVHSFGVEREMHTKFLIEKKKTW